MIKCKRKTSDFSLAFYHKLCITSFIIFIVKIGKFINHCGIFVQWMKNRRFFIHCTKIMLNEIYPKTQLPPGVHFDGVERDDNTALTGAITGPELGPTIFGGDLFSKRKIHIRLDFRTCSDLQCSVWIGRVEDKERTFWMRMEIFHLLARVVERELDCAILIQHKPERCDLWIAIWPKRGEHGNICFEEVLMRLRESGHRSLLLFQ